MYFGYLNRNYAETPVVPVGPENKFEPGDPDRGQPTFFDRRVHRKEFSVRLLSDWGKNELVWSLTVRGVTASAIARFQRGWALDHRYVEEVGRAQPLMK